MRETSGRPSRVSTKVKAAVVALLAIFAFSAIGTSSASAAKTLKLSFNDSWIKVDALGETGSFHALDPTDPAAQKVDVTGTLADDGAFLAKKEDFNFPTQVIDAGAGFGNIELQISAVQDITGNYNESTGVFTGQMPLSLVVNVAALSTACKLSPLNIPLSTTGTKNFGTAAGDLAASPFAGGNGAAIGSWTNVTVANVTGVPPTEDQGCKDLIQVIMDAQSISSFDGSIWLKGTSTVAGTNPATTCPTGQVGTPPNCSTASAAKISKVVASPKKLAIKAKKKGTLKVAVTNGGGQAATNVKVCATAPAKLAGKPKCVTIKSIAAGKSATASIKFTAKKKKGTGAIKVSVTSGNAGKGSAKATLQVK